MQNDNELDLRHNVGDNVQLQFFPGNEDERYYVKLLGFNAGKSIIITTPRLNGAALHIKNEQEFIVRLVSGHSAQGFTASVMHLYKYPFPHLHLTFPDNLQSTSIRKAERIDCQLIVSVKKDKEDSQGKSASLSNLSSVGAQLNSNEVIGEKGDTLTIQSKVTVADVDQYLNISGVIRRTAEKENTSKDKFEYGVEFNITDVKDKILLHAFIYEKMLNI